MNFPSQSEVDQFIGHISRGTKGRNGEKDLAMTMVGKRGLNSLVDNVRSVFEDKVPGDFIECGTWRGGCCILMAWLISKCKENRKVYVADSFQGLPRGDAEKYPLDAKSKHYKHKWLRAPLEDVKSNFRELGLLDDNIVFVEGFFRDTIPTLHVGPLAILRLDGDIYESTIICLESLEPKVSSGGVVIIDDYKKGRVQAACSDYYGGISGISSLNIKRVPKEIAWWRKP